MYATAILASMATPAPKPFVFQDNITILIAAHVVLTVHLATTPTNTPKVANNVDLPVQNVQGHLLIAWDVNLSTE